MTDQAYSEVQKLDDEINRCCIARDMSGAYRALLAKRALQAGVAVVSVAASLALPGVAQAAVTKAQLHEAKALVKQTVGSGYFLAGTPQTIACHATSGTKITCIVKRGAGEAPGANRSTTVVVVLSNGKLNFASPTIACNLNPNGC